MALTAGNKAPDFKTTDQDGKEVTLSSLKGKKVVLYFYPRDMTSGCTAEACSLRDNYKALQKAGYEVLGVSSDNEKTHKKFIEKEKLPFRLLADTDKKVVEDYGTWKEKSMYGKTYMGIERTTFIIDKQGKISHIFPKVKVDEHYDEVIDALAE